eukprot:scaffold1519_cov166-Amphora_coffeaeformis.AAC.2
MQDNLNNERLADGRGTGGWGGLQSFSPLPSEEDFESFLGDAVQDPQVVKLMSQLPYGTLSKAAFKKELIAKFSSNCSKKYQITVLFLKKFFKTEMTAAVSFYQKLSNSYHSFGREKQPAIHASYDDFADTKLFVLLVGLSPSVACASSITETVNNTQTDVDDGATIETLVPETDCDTLVLVQSMHSGLNLTSKEVTQKNGGIAISLGDGGSDAVGTQGFDFEFGGGTQEFFDGMLPHPLSSNRRVATSNKIWTSNDTNTT